MTAEPKKLPRIVRDVVAGGNCSGCGACAQLWPEIRMDLDEEGFSRPVSDVVIESGRAERQRFDRICPGSKMVAPDRGAKHHWLFGAYEQAWEGHALDEEIRRQGSSGGVLTALASYLAERERGVIVGVAASAGQPTRSTPVRIMSRDEALAASGSRYAPVSVGASDSVVGAVGVIAKPCEVAALRALEVQSSGDRTPLLLSFFCAGTPSQHATTRLLASRAVYPDELKSLRYRGDGWPGDFVGTKVDGEQVRVTYDDSWGKYLGRDLQPRCKLCVDGTGEYSDVSVGDYWQTDEGGYPMFLDAPGSSVIIAHTPRGARLVAQAVEAGILSVGSVDLNDVANIQPLQRARRRTLFGRLAGRRLAGKRIPRYGGFSLFKVAIKDVKGNLRAAAGMWIRTIRAKRR